MCFFFQAEDGIRDKLVTGVQTCALPISKAVVTGDPTQVDLPGHKRSGLIEAIRILRGVDGIALMEFQKRDVVRHEIGRASCRKSVDLGGRRMIKNTNEKYRSAEKKMCKE